MLIWLKNQGKVRYRTFQLRLADGEQRKAQKFGEDEFDQDLDARKAEMAERFEGPRKKEKAQEEALTDAIALLTTRDKVKQVTQNLANSSIF